MEQLFDNIKQLLLRPNWRDALIQAREQLPKSAEGALMPLAEIMTQAQSGLVIEAIGKIRELARSGHLRSAMDEAFDSFKFAPTYLPLHTLIGDLLIDEGRTQDAIAKYTVVAQAYSVRGEPAQAVTLLRRIVQVAPMDLTARSRLIDSWRLMARWMRPLGNTSIWPISIAAWRNWIWPARPTPPPCGWPSKAMPTGPGVSNCSSAWPISICSTWIGARPCASSSRSARSSRTIYPPART